MSQRFIHQACKSQGLVFLEAVCRQGRRGEGHKLGGGWVAGGNQGNSQAGKGAMRLGVVRKCMWVPKSLCNDAWKVTMGQTMKMETA